MLEILKGLIDLYGPTMMPALVICGALFSWLYHSLLRQMAVKQNRLLLVLVDEDIIPLEKLWKYGILDDSVTPANLLLERMK